MRKYFLFMLMALWQAEAYAALTCSDIFGPRPAAASESDIREMNEAFAKLTDFNRRVKFANFLTGGLQEQATNESLKSLVIGVEFNIEHSRAAEVLKDHEGMTVDVVKAYATLKLTQARADVLRALTKPVRKERAELRKLESIRTRSLIVIGTRAIQYRQLIGRLEKYKNDSTQMKFAERAAWVIEHLGVPASRLRQFPELAEYLGSRTEFLNPTVSQINDIFNGRDEGLSPGEKMTAKLAKVDRDIRVQITANVARGISAVASDSALRDYTRAIFKKWIREDNTDALIDNASTSFGDASRVLAQYGSVEHLKRYLETPEEQYLYFRRMFAEFGGSSIAGVPEFMLTLARREDALTVWNSLKTYVQANASANIIMGADLTLLQAMDQAEKARAAGFLISPMQPYSKASFKVAKALATILVAMYLANLLREHWLDSGSEKSDSAPKPPGKEPAKESTKPATPAAPKETPSEVCHACVLPIKA